MFGIEFVPEDASIDHSAALNRRSGQILALRIAGRTQTASYLRSEHYDSQDNG